MTTEHVSSAVFIGLCINATVSVIVGLFILNWLIIFYSFNKTGFPALVYRKPKSILFFGSILCFAALIRIPTFATFIYNGIGWFKGADVITHITLQCTSLLMLYVLIYRAYLVYFDIKFSQALQNDKWRHHIDTSSNSTNWFIQNRKTFGRPRNVAITIGIIWSLFAISGTASVILDVGSWYLISLGCTIFIQLFSLLILVYKLPKFNDVWKVREETKKISIITLILAILWFAVKIILKSSPGSMEQNIVTGFHILILTIPPYISFFWVFRQFKLPIWICTIKTFQLSMDDQFELNNIVSRQSTIGNELSATNHSGHEYEDNGEQITTPQPITVDVQIQKQDVNHLKFRTIFNDPQWLNLFAMHLTHEFAIENILFLLETQQFVKAMKDLINMKEDDECKLDSLKITSEAPQSTIVKELRDKLETKTDEKERINAMYFAAIRLFLKYISEDARFSINISSANRYRLNMKFSYLRVYHNNDKSIEQQMIEQMNENNTSKIDIKHIFDESRMEIFKLMQHSFSRFKILMTANPE